MSLSWRSCQGLSLACLVRLLQFACSVWLPFFLVVVQLVLFGLSLACLVCLLLFVKCFVSIGFLCGCRFVSQLGFSSGPVTGLLACCFS